ncbi:CAF17-like 4Fe-4S cluster assembly/insertion protein YgfZ [Leptothoe kymatousa]|uniref:Folate-binding protein YgfZ n=1 Tax=Leptothoe kymatousa TAU-MAC 1615 TaxID=2364775 RepID=A0ABS5Y1H4_9CYAN|nr:folate-binding protein [Leptothoe kymatousa]MBT9311651.1 folate-binding protein YgfZ [Leptothoe kymatousa TAU-MAC 1615]
MVEVAGPIFINRSHWGRIRVAGADRLRFLHNQTTNAFQQLAPGQGCETVFVTSTARTVDLGSAYIDHESVLLMVSPGMAAELIAWMDRYIFFADKVTLSDETDTTFAITLLGTEADRPLTQLQLPLPDGAVCSHLQGTAATPLGDIPIQVIRGTGLATPGFTLIGPKAQEKVLQQWLTQQGIAALTPQQWESMRVRQGRPMPGAELTKDDNPLEAGLWHTISFEKGCYIGQETIARLNTYQGVKKQLWGFKLGQPVPPDTQLKLEGAVVGKITSVISDDTGVWALGYLRTKAGGEGTVLTVENTTAQAVSLPLATRGYLS